MNLQPLILAGVAAAVAVVTTVGLNIVKPIKHEEVKSEMGPPVDTVFAHSIDNPEVQVAQNGPTQAPPPEAPQASPQAAEAAAANGGQPTTAPVEVAQAETPAAPAAAAPAPAEPAPGPAEAAPASAEPAQMEGPTGATEAPPASTVVHGGCGPAIQPSPKDGSKAGKGVKGTVVVAGAEGGAAPPPAEGGVPAEMPAETAAAPAEAAPAPEPAPAPAPAEAAPAPAPEPAPAPAPAPAEPSPAPAQMAASEPASSEPAPAPKPKAVTKAKPKAPAAPPKDARKAWWPATESGKLNLLFVGEASFTKAIVVLTDGEFGDGSSATSNITVTGPKGKVNTKWLVATNKKMLLLNVDPGKYTVKVGSGLKDSTGKAVAKSTSGPVYVH